MNQGAFALLDCLGFKGIWERQIDPRAIVGFLQAAKDESELSPVRTLWKAGHGDRLNIATAFVSDTIVVSASVSEGTSLDTNWQRGALVQLVSHLCIELLSQFAFRAPKPLLLRGCVTYGPHLVQDSFFLGPAVDEAAALFQTAQGAFVWLTPTSSELFDTYQTHIPVLAREQLNRQTDQHVGIADTMMNRLSIYSQLNREDVAPIVSWWKQLPSNRKHEIATYVLEKAFAVWRTDDVVNNYPMELRQGASLNTSVLNPLFRVPLSKHPEAISRVLASFDSPNLDVMLKKQNTDRFLSIASKATTQVQLQVRQRLEAIRQDLRRMIGTAF